MRNLTHHWLTGQALGTKQEDKLCLLSGLWSHSLSLSLSHGGLQLLKPGRAVPARRPVLTLVDQERGRCGKYPGREKDYEVRRLLAFTRSPRAISTHSTGWLQSVGNGEHLHGTTYYYCLNIILLVLGTVLPGFRSCKPPWLRLSQRPWDLKPLRRQSLSPWQGRHLCPLYPAWP